MIKSMRFKFCISSLFEKCKGIKQVFQGILIVAKPHLAGAFAGYGLSLEPTGIRHFCNKRKGIIGSLDSILWIDPANLYRPCDQFFNFRDFRNRTFFFSIHPNLLNREQEGKKKNNYKKRVS